MSWFKKKQEKVLVYDEAKRDITMMEFDKANSRLLKDNRCFKIAMSQAKQDTYSERMTTEFTRLLRKLSKPKKSFAERNLWVFYLGFLFNIAAIFIYALTIFKNTAYWNGIYIVLHYIFLGQMIWGYQKYKLNQREEVANAI